MFNEFNAFFLQWCKNNGYTRRKRRKTMHSNPMNGLLIPDDLEQLIPNIEQEEVVDNDEEEQVVDAQEQEQEVHVDEQQEDIERDSNPSNREAV